MANYVRKKEALRAALYSFLAGIHCLTEEVERTQGLIYEDIKNESEQSREARHLLLVKNLEVVLESDDAIRNFVEQLNLEGLYPFYDNWPEAFLNEMYKKIILPPLVFGKDVEKKLENSSIQIDPYNLDVNYLKFRFRKGFKKILNEAALAATTLGREPSSIDHWLVLIVNTGFHAGMTICAQFSENSRIYYDTISSLEACEDLWTRYPQIQKIIDRQLKRETKRKTGLVSDVDDS